MSILLETDPFLASALSAAISPETVVVPDLVALRRLLVDDPRHELVVIGPDVEMSVVDDFTSAERVARPSLGVVLVRRRLDTAVLKVALKAGVRVVVKLDDLEDPRAQSVGQDGRVDPSPDEDDRKPRS